MLLNPKRHWVEIAREYLMIFLALAPFALMVNWIFVPHNVVGGGLTGICSIIYYATQGLFPALFPAYGGALPIWLTTLVINCILLLIAALTVGWRFCIRTVFGVFVLAFWYRLIPIREEALIEDPLLGCTAAVLVRLQGQLWRRKRRCRDILQGCLVPQCHPLHRSREFGHVPGDCCEAGHGRRELGAGGFPLQESPFQT